MTFSRSSLAKVDRSQQPGELMPKTLAGLISTNTAPATPKRTIFEVVEWIEFLTIAEDGRTVTKRRVEKDESAFRAAICSLGAIGVITQLGIRVVEESFYKTIQRVVPLEDVLGDMDATSSDPPQL